MFSYRTVAPADRQQLTNLIHFEACVHRHLDWRSAFDWIGFDPFILAEKDGILAAALVCPAGTGEASWIRLFACSSETTPSEAWSLLWPVAYQKIRTLNAEPVAAIALQSWFAKLVRDSGFEPIHQVILLQWEPQTIPASSKTPKRIIRDMQARDLIAIEKLDHLAFNRLWQNSYDSLEYAFRQAAIARVIENRGKILSYQISTATQGGGHLARLATHPEYQGMGLGYSLLQDLLSRFMTRGATRVTVNTQQDNTVSLAMYKKAGFTVTGESYPVYQFPPK